MAEQALYRLLCFYTIIVGNIICFRIVQTPRRETYYPCEGLISGTFNGDYFAFYHNYFIFSKI